MKRKRKLKKKFAIFLSIYAVFLVSYFTIVTVAKYTSLLNKNSNVSVAKWEVDVIANDNQTLPTMIIGNSSSYQNYNLTVTSTSEIAIDYSLIITNVPTGVQIQIDDDSIYSENNHTITVMNLGFFSAEDINSTHNHKLTMILPLGISAINNQTLDIDVIFTQSMPAS